MTGVLPGEGGVAGAECSLVWDASAIRDTRRRASAASNLFAGHCDETISYTGTTGAMAVNNPHDARGYSDVTTPLFGEQPWTSLV